MTVPNRFPTIPDPQGRRLAVIGEAPGRDEVDYVEEQNGKLVSSPQPFVGASGRLLRLVLSQSGINSSSCLLGNVCQSRPDDNDITNLPWDSEEIQSGIELLKHDLETFKPNAILALGRTAFRFFNPERCYAVKKTIENPDGIRVPLSDWRGSPFVGSTGHKVIPGFHPAYVLRSPGDIAYLRADISRSVKHSGFSDLRSTARVGNLRPSFDETLGFLSQLRASKCPCAFDIEGYSDAIGVTMLSIAPTPTTGIVIPFFVDGQWYWSDDYQEAVIWKEVAAWLEDPTCPKIAHNAFYETLVLGWRHKIAVAGIVGDTMMKHWEMFNELEKSLGVCTSLWIEEPYYKDERHSTGTAKLSYNFKDSACTKGIDEAIEPHLRKLSGPSAHYDFNVSLIPAYTYMHLRGCRFDGSAAAAHKSKAQAELLVLMEKIDAVTLPILGHPFNVKSTTDKKWYLYDHLALEPYKRYGETTKEEVLHRFFKKTKDPTLQRIIQAVSLRTRISDVEKLTPNPDGRIRTSYDLVSTVTGRLNSRESSVVEAIGVNKRGDTVYTDYGTNLQNVTKPIRDCFVPDGDEWTFWQADLEGADAWTVAADLAARGDPRMLADLRAKVKPAKLLLAMLQDIEAGRDPSNTARLEAQEAKAICDAIIIPEGTLEDGRPADWKYTCLKRVQHGTNYLGQSETISATIFKDSDGVIDIPPIEIDRYQRLYKLRYNIDLRKAYITECLSRDGSIQTAAGPKRKFFGIRNPRMPEDDIVRQAMASEPQTNTTYVTNLALKKLWYDPENRRKTGGLFIEPLLQIHDALAGQFPTRLKDFAKQKLQDYFHNEITINGIKLVIPVEIKIGRSWGKCKSLI